MTHEAEQLEAAATALDVPLPTVCAEVTRCGGDLRAALATLTSLPQPQQRLRVSGGVSGGSIVVGSPAAGSSQQRHQRQFSLLGLGACSPGRPSSGALVDPQDPQVSATKAHVSGPIGTWPARSNNDGVSSVAASQQGPLMGALPPHPSGRQMAGSGFESSAPSAAGSLSNMHSRVSSFDMLSMGAPWSELLTNRRAPLPEVCGGVTHTPWQKPLFWMHSPSTFCDRPWIFWKMQYGLVRGAWTSQAAR